MPLERAKCEDELIEVTARLLMLLLSSEICKLSADAGKCSNSLTRYYYDPQLDDCRRFIYGGCHGNANRFLTYSDCATTCVQEQQTVQNDVDVEGKYLLFVVPHLMLIIYLQLHCTFRNIAV